MFVLVNYANENYQKAQKLNSYTAKIVGGFDKIYEWSNNDIEKDYYEEHKDILNVPRGNGLWLWKPYFILKTLEVIDEDDILFYCDSASFFIRNVKKVIIKDMQESKTDIWVTALPLLEKQFTQKRTFVRMDCMSEKYTETNQIQATFLAIKKTEKTIEFVKEWLNFCEDLIVLKASEDTEDTVTDLFIAHREDQSVLSLLCKKYNIKAHQDPTQYGKYPEMYGKKEGSVLSIIDYDEKPQSCIVLHRTSYVDKNVCLRYFLLAVLPKPFGLNLVKCFSLVKLRFKKFICK